MVTEPSRRRCYELPSVRQCASDGLRGVPALVRNNRVVLHATTQLGSSAVGRWLREATCYRAERIDDLLPPNDAAKKSFSQRFKLNQAPTHPASLGFTAWD